MSEPAIEPQSTNPATAPVQLQAGHELGHGSAIGEASANFWREFMYWWAAHWPAFVLITRPFFLWFALTFSKALRDGPAANARRILGQNASEAEVTRLSKNIVKSAYTSIYELGRAARSSPKQFRDWIEEVEGSERYFAARKSENGAILLTAHLGPFEVGASSLMAHEPKIHVLFQRDALASFDRLRGKLRERIGVHELALDDGWSIWAAVRDVLNANEVVLIQGDRVMAGQRGVPVRFFDGHVLMPTGPVKLAMVTGSPIIPVFSVRTRVGRCRVFIDEPIDVQREPGPVSGEHPAMRRIAEAIERQVRAHPDQWAVYERAWCEDQEASSTSNATEST